jgi:hypothetical protein
MIIKIKNKSQLLSYITPVNNSNLKENTTAFTIALHMKHLSINITKIHKICTENYKTLMKEIKEYKNI